MNELNICLQPKQTFLPCKEEEFFSFEILSSFLFLLLHHFYYFLQLVAGWVCLRENERKTKTKE
jgi:hypothetical protein